MNNSYLLKRVLGDISGTIVSASQINLLERIYGLENEEIEVRLEPNYYHKGKHPNCTLFVGVRSEQVFQNIGDFRDWLRPKKLITKRDLTGKYKELDGFTTYYFERSGLCAAFINNAPRF